MMVLPYIELNPTRDEWQDRRTRIGIFLGSGFCLLGFRASRLGVPGETPGWQAGIIVLNIAFGIWKSPKSEK
jgi:hypothetical protein